MSQKGILYLALTIASIVGACSVVKKEDPAQSVRTFLSSFHIDLTRSDQEILKHFRVRQSPEAVLAVIRILQNKEKYFVCDARFAEADILIQGEEIRVTIPAVFKTNGLESQAMSNAMLQFWLSPEDKSYVITRLEGDDFYNTFMRMKNNNEWGIKGKTAVESRLPIYAKARALEAKFDTVIYYATYKDEDYFYVAEGEWINHSLSSRTRDEQNVGVKMGLADADGKLIIPMEYDLIGTIGFERPDLVEVKKDGKFGYFDIQTRTLIVEPNYDMIIPVTFENVFAMVRQDSVSGWLTKYYEYEQGFPSQDVQQWFENYTYLRKTLRLASGSQVFCEIPSEQYAGNGILMPPSYLVKHRVFDEIEHGIITTEVPLHGYTEYKESQGSWLQRITDGFGALTTSIQERYLAGREEFYNSTTILFVDNDYDTLGEAHLSGTEISIRAIDSTLLEVKTPHDWWFMEEEVCEETNLYLHKYFAIGEDGSIRQLKSNRLFPETEFVRLDSSYITGQFLVYDRKLDAEVPTSILSMKTLTSMRDEILACYGYSFPETDKAERYDTRWYLPVYANIEDVTDLLNDIDRHNFEFLERIITAMQSDVAAEPREEVLPDTDEPILPDTTNII
ncbi:MAG: WG repeat-containing protein [Chryseosolibacter sp.]